MENETFLIWVWKHLPNRRVLENREMTAIRNGPKQTISTSGELGLLQMVSELGIERCASEDVGSPRGVDCEIPRRLERRTKHSLYGCGNLSLTNPFTSWVRVDNISCYKWYQSQSLSGVPARMLGSRGGGL